MSAQEELEKLIQDVAERIAQCNAEDLPEQALALAWVRDRLAAIREGLGKEPGEVAASSPDDIRAEGWAVAVHNDYRLGGVAHTFWLFTKGGLAIKGEGTSDAYALNEAREQIGIPLPAIPPADSAQGLVDALAKIARVNAMDYEYQRWAREAIAAHKSEVKG